MLSIVQAWSYRLRRSLWGFPRGKSSGRRLAALFLVAGVACSVGLNWLLPVAGQLLLWTILLLIGAWLVRHAGPWSFGPVFFYDLVRSSRRGEQVGHRCVYALLLIGVLAVLYWS